MKITDLAIVFILFTIPFLLVTKIKSNNLSYASYKKVELNRILDTSVEDGASALFEEGKINKNKCIDIFLRSLFINLNILDNNKMKEKIMNYIPVIVVLDIDGFYILSLEEFVNENNKKEFKRIWSPKIFYSYSDEKFIYKFCLDGRLKVYKKDAGVNYSGTYDDIIKKIDIIDTILEDKKEYESIRQREIVFILEKNINFKINNHNNFIRNMEIDYEFTMPTISHEDWSNTISDTGLLVFFQGMPIGNSGKRYNNFVLGGSKVIKTNSYYVVTDTTTGRKEYHSKDCEDLKSIIIDIENNPDDTIYNIDEFKNRYDSTLTGAFPCEKCK